MGRGDCSPPTPNLIAGGTEDFPQSLGWQHGLHFSKGESKVSESFASVDYIPRSEGRSQKLTSQPYHRLDL